MKSPPALLLRRRTTSKIRTRISKDVRKVYNVKARDVSSTVKLLNRSKGTLEHRILLYIGGHIPLAKFDAKPRVVRSRRGPRRGVTVRVRKDSGRKLVGKRSGFHGAGFLAKGKVMARKTPAGPSHRMHYGPAITQMVANESVIENYPHLQANTTSFPTIENAWTMVPVEDLSAAVPALYVYPGPRSAETDLWETNCFRQRITKAIHIFIVCTPDGFESLWTEVWNALAGYQIDNQYQGLAVAEGGVQKLTGQYLWWRGTWQTRRVHRQGI